MAVPIRTVTSEEVSRLIDAAPALTDLDASMLDTVLSYIEGNDLESAKTYVAAMGEPSLARTLRNLIQASQIIAAALMRKRILRSDGNVGTEEGR